jgi:dolichol-phosphate mannosyltransferase
MFNDSLENINYFDNKSKCKSPSISVILSFFNEANVIPELVKRLRIVFASELIKNSISKYEIIFVNDASTDNSLQVLLNEFKINNDLVIINMSNNFGVSECVLAGMKFSKSDLVIYMDADLQDPPEVIPDLISKWHSDPEIEVVFTTRLSRDGEHPLKLLITKLGYKLIQAISDINIPENSGDFKLLSRRVVNHILSMPEKKPYLRGMISWVGFKQSPVFYNREKRFDGRENTKRRALSFKVINYALDSAIISFSDAPLKAVLAIGFLLSSSSLLYIFVIIFQKIMGWYTPGWPAIMAAILLIGGIQLMMLGIVGLYISNIFINAKGRPDYIIDNIIANDRR